MSTCYPFRPVPGQCGPRGRGPLPAPPFDPRDYWATKKFVSSLVSPIKISVTNLQETKLDRSDVVDPAVAAEDGKAADAKKTQEEMDRILGVASGAMALAESKADKATTLAGYGITDAATKVELASKADLVGGKIPSSQLPAFVDDVLEYDAMSDFPAVGEDGKIYISKDTNLTYRWGGTQYVEISQSLALGETASTAYPGDKGKAATETAIAAYDTASSMAGKITSHIEDKGNPHAVTAEQAGAVPLVKDTAGAKTAVTIGSRIPGKEIGEHSFANGYFVNAPGGYSHAEGHETTTRGYFSHAEGESTIADGDFSHADGCYSHTRTDDTYAFAWSGDGGRTSPYPSHGPGTFNINPLGGLDGFYIGDRKFSEILANKVDKTALTAHTENTSNPHGVTAEQIGALSISPYLGSELIFSWEPNNIGIALSGNGSGIGLSVLSGVCGFYALHGNDYDWYQLPTGKSGTLALVDDISETNPDFSNAVLAVGLNIDTNSVAVLNEIAATFGGFPIGGTATTVGGLLAALAAAAAWLKKNKVQTLKLDDGSIQTSADGGAAKLDDFFTESNSLLISTIAANSARLALDEEGEIIVTMNTED